MRTSKDKTLYGDFDHKHPSDKFKAMGWKRKKSPSPSCEMCRKKTRTIYEIDLVFRDSIFRQPEPHKLILHFCSDNCTTLYMFKHGWV